MMNAARDQKVNSAKGIAYLYLNMKKFDDAKKYYRMAGDMDPNDPEPYYSVGVIDWTACYQPRMEERAKLGLKPEENLNPKNKDQKKVCDELKVKNGPSIQEGIESLNKAIQLRPDYDDAMAYLNLMYREKADVECDDLSQRQEDLKTADHWVDQTLLTKKAKAEKQPGAQGITHGSAEVIESEDSATCPSRGAGIRDFSPQVRRARSGLLTVELHFCLTGSIRRKLSGAVANVRIPDDTMLKRKFSSQPLVILNKRSLSATTRDWLASVSGFSHDECGVVARHHRVKQHRRIAMQMPVGGMRIRDRPRLQ